MIATFIDDNGYTWKSSKEYTIEKADFKENADKKIIIDGFTEEVSYTGDPVEPDYKVELSEEKLKYFYELTIDEDDQLQKGIEVLNSL